MCLSLVLVAMDNTILNVAIPTLGRELPASRTELQWIVDGYILVFAGLLLVGGALGDRYGRRRALTCGLIVFAVGSVAAAYSPDAIALIASRGLMGAAAALIMPATLSIITATFRDPIERAKAIGVWSGVSGLGIALGPVAGGWLIEHFWWGSAFLVNLPVIAVALVAAPLVVPESRDPEKRPIDVAGAVLSVAAMTMTLWTVIEAPEHGWTSRHTITGFAVSAALLGAFAWWERRTPDPLLPMEFFANPRFSAASIAIALAFFALLGSMFLVTQYMQSVAGYSALGSGLRYIPLAATLFVAAPIGPRLVHHIGSKIVVATGLTTAAVGLALLVRVDTSSGFTPLLISQVVMAAGLGLSLAPATEAIMGSLPPSQAGVGSAVNDTTRELGGALGVAVLGSLFASRYIDHLRPSTELLTDDARHVALDSIAGADMVAGTIEGDVGLALRQQAAEAFVAGLHAAAITAAAVALIGAVIVLACLPARAIDDVDPVDDVHRRAASSSRAGTSSNRRSSS
jgi:EmrB/QacA subfamily drug resistance transporter